MEPGWLDRFEQKTRTELERLSVSGPVDCCGRRGLGIAAIAQYDLQRLPLMMVKLREETRDFEEHMARVAIKERERKRRECRRKKRVPYLT
jgi:hypothetical protein